MSYLTVDDVAALESGMGALEDVELEVREGQRSVSVRGPVDEVLEFVCKGVVLVGAGAAIVQLANRLFSR